MTLTDFLLARIAEDEENAGIHPSRFRAECGAKRRIVARYSADADGCSDEDLRDLAAIYADHPDYREEWRA